MLDREELEEIANMDRDAFALAFENAAASGARARRLAPGDPVEGSVVGLGGGEVFVDVGDKAEARIDVDAFTEVPSPGDVLTAWVIGRRNGIVVLGLSPPVSDDPQERRDAERAQRDATRAHAFAKLEVGMVMPGKVTGIQDFGAFVDVGGVQGLIRLRNLSSERVAHPSDVVEVGQSLRVRVLKLEPGTGRIDLGLRQVIEASGRRAGVGDTGAIATLGDLLGRLDLD
jgi:small subunit ribosomal protein S1